MQAIITVVRAVNSDLGLPSPNNRQTTKHETRPERQPYALYRQWQQAKARNFTGKPNPC